MNSSYRTGVERTNTPLSVTELTKALQNESKIRGTSHLGALPDGFQSPSSNKMGAGKTARSEVNKKCDDDVNQLETNTIAFASGLVWPEKSWCGTDGNVGIFLRRGSLVAFGVWVVGMLFMNKLCPADSFEYLSGTERNANIAVLTALLCTNASRFLHLVVRDKSFVFVNTGIMFGAVAVQLIAILSIIFMVFFPTPVLIDPVTGLRSHMFRWVEWVVLGFLMTFLTESIDMPLKDSGGSKMAWIHGTAIGVSTAAGGIFPFCKTWGAWLSVLTISWILFCSLFYRLYCRYHRFVKMPKEGSPEVKDDYERAKYSLKTISVCTVAWTLLAVSFTVIAIAKPFAPEGSIFSSESLVLVTESIFEIISKIWYFNLLVDVHNIVFDDASRTMRRLEELRVVMATIWNTSSDVMVWCSTEGDRVQAVISPSFFDLGNTPSDAEKLRRLAPNHKKPTLVLEVDKLNGSYLHRIIELDLNSAVTRQDAVDLLLNESGSKRSFSPATPAVEKSIDGLAKLVMDVFRSDQKEMVMMKNLHGTESKIICEAKITKLGSSCLVVLRDISERFERFETEKKLVEEITARRKDAEANRFTRHEVKNSILAAIG